MEPVNWIAVLLSAMLATAVAIVWYGPVFRRGRDLLPGDSQPPGKPWIVGLVVLVGATMLGHNFARIGSETLAEKPWLYFMQSGGIALAFVIPAIWLTYLREGAPRRVRLIEIGYWLVAYLGMGAVFWVLA